MDHIDNRPLALRGRSSLRGHPSEIVSSFTCTLVISYISAGQGRNITPPVDGRAQAGRISSFMHRSHDWDTDANADDPPHNADPTPSGESPKTLKGCIGALDLTNIS
jgi:hypothetical protein